MVQKHYPDIDPNPNFAALEEEILRFWQADGTFQKSIDQRPHGNGNDYVFYDGPPFANGLPHYGHLLTGYVKDAIARYHTMKGKRVERRFGWDCHGLPAEMGAEKDLGISGRAAIMEFGIDKFNAHCRTSVMKYTQDWNYYVTRQGRWVDFEHDYKTMDTPFMESCIWAFSELYKKGLVYESMRVMPYSWAAETPVSNFETRIDNATREREDKAAYVKFKLKEKPQGAPEAENYYLIAWTTTPWTLPSNLALAVGDIVYKAWEFEGNCYISAYNSENKINDKMWPADTKVITAELNKNNLIGLTYEPLFPYFADTPNAFRVLDGSAFVTEGDGTGIVHMAPGFGEVDQQCCNENGIETLVPVDEKGRFTDAIFDLDDLQLKGLVVVADNRIPADSITVSEADKAQHIAEKDVAKYGLVNMRIVRWLKAHGKLVKDEPLKHNYPHCWRTDTPLIYRAMSSWYVNVQAIKDNMAANNQTIRWIPEHVQDGQMGKGIESAPDWSISRNRFWGTPIPIWKAPSGKIIVPGSIAEIEQLSGQKVADLHRPFIDDVTFEQDGETYSRIEDVFDCWFESGSMPYAQLHYPFENKETFEANFPADFITEYIAQTRGWFYTLQVLSAALFGCAPFKNVICHGVVIDEETGLKYSKRLKNYRDPKEVMDAYGADALRWMMLASPVMRGADLGVDPEGKFIRDVVRLNIKPLWSAFNFFTLYANADGVRAKAIATSDNALDRYILAKAKAAVVQAQASLDAYDTPGATEAITAFFDVLNNWYIRRSRARFWRENIGPITLPNDLNAKWEAQAARNNQTKIQYAKDAIIESALARGIDYEQEQNKDKQAAYDTLFTVLNLLVTAAAPLLPFTAEMVYRGLNSAANSVHLQDFPDVSAIADEAELVADMDRVRDACTSMASIRAAENIRNRQPLASATLYGAGAERLKPFAELMQDELNVRKIRFSNSLEGVAEYTLTVNFPIAGKRLGAKMKAVGAAAKAGDWKNENGQVIVGGEAMEPGEYTLQLKPLINKGAQRLSSNDALVVLDLAITPELEAEGRARDLVRMIQQARKDAGLHVADRIALALDLPADFAAALATHRDYIADQVLAVSIGTGAAQADTQLTQELDGAQFVIGISKAA